MRERRPNSSPARMNLHRIQQAILTSTSIWFRNELQSGIDSKVNSKFERLPAPEPEPELGGGGGLEDMVNKTEVCGIRLGKVMYWTASMTRLGRNPSPLIS
jgi:hypothetical protein